MMSIRSRLLIVWLCLAVSPWLVLERTGQMVLCQAIDGSVELEYKSNAAQGACPKDATESPHPGALSLVLPDPETGCVPCIDSVISTQETVLQDSPSVLGAADLPVAGVLSVAEPYQSLRSFETYGIEQAFLQSFSLIIVTSTFLLI